MALFKISKGLKANLPSAKTAGNCWYTIDDSLFYIDYEDTNGEVQRKALNAKDAETLTGASLETILNSSDIEIPTSKAVLDALAEKADVEHTHGISEVDGLSDVIANLSGDMSTNYNESIIGLSIDGQVITYIKGDGSQHTIITQDTNTTYSLATDEVTGLTKLYATTGSAEDGTMTQKAIKTELDKKVGVSMDDTNDMLIFTI